MIRKKNGFLFALIGAGVIGASLMISIVASSGYVSKAITLLEEGATFSRLFDKALVMLGDSRARQVVPMIADNPESQGLPVYRLNISPSDVAHFAKFTEASLEHGSKIESLNRWRKAKIKFDGESHPVKIRIHGTATDQFSSRKKSYSIKSNDPINGLIRFSLVNSASLESFYNYELLKLLGLLNVKSDLVFLYINNEPFGIYLLEERPNTKLLEKNGFATSLILKTKSDYRNIHSTGHQTTYDLSSFNVESETYEPMLTDPDAAIQKSVLFPDVDGKRNAVATAALERLFQAVQEHDHKEILDLIDLDGFAKMEAFRFLSTQVHYVIGDNRRFVYDHSRGRFLFLFPRPEGGINPYWRAPSDVGRFESQFYDFEFLQSVQRPFLLVELATIPEFRKRRNFYLMEFLKRKADIIGLHKSIYAKYRLMVYSDNAVFYEKDLSGLIEYHRRQTPFLENNLEILAYSLSYGRIFVGIDVHNDSINIDINVDSNTPLKISSLSIGTEDSPARRAKLREHDAPSSEVENVSASGPNRKQIDLTGDLQSKSFMSTVDANLVTILDKITVKVPGDFRDIEIEEALVTAQLEWFENPIPGDNINVVVRDFRSFDEVIESDRAIDYLVAMGAKNDGGLVTLGPEIVRIDRTLDLRQTAGMVLLPGTTLEIGPGISLVGLASLIAEGTEDAPITVRASGTRPFGSIVVIGDGTTACKFSNFSLSGGSEGLVNGTYSSGALVVSRCPTTMVRSEIVDNRSEDGLNIKDSAVSISASTFSGNFSDQLDLDNSVGTVRGSTFVASQSSTGDGLDMSGSKLIVEGNSFKNFQDKGVSVGEKSYTLVKSNLFDGNVSGIAVKDSSVAFIRSNVFSENGINLTTYIKKPYFAEPTVWLLDETDAKGADIRAIDGEVGTFVPEGDLKSALDNETTDLQVLYDLLSQPAPNTNFTN